MITFADRWYTYMELSIGSELKKLNDLKEYFLQITPTMVVRKYIPTDISKIELMKKKQNDSF